MKCIAACDDEWAIGKDNRLLISIPEDMKFFRRMTTGKVVVMGRRTLESFPHKKPLPDRVNIVMTRNPSYRAEGAVVVRTEEELKEALAPYGTDDVFVIGGESIYRQLLPWCDTAYITRIHMTYDADAWFPDLEADPDWEMTETSGEQTYFDAEYEFTVWQRKGTSVCR